MDIKDVENLAQLVRIELSEEEKQFLLGDMQGILEYVKVIEDLKVDDSNSPEKEEYKLYNITREDEGDKREFSPIIISGQFPDSQDGFLKVKKIL